MRRALIFVGLGLMAGSPLVAQAPAHPHLLMVVAKQQPGVALYDADTDQLVCKSQPMGLSPHEAEFSPDGRTAYVPVYGSTSVGVPGTDEHEIQFIRTSDCQTVAKMDTGEYKRPHNVAVGRSGMVYVTAELKESILIIDPQKREIVGTIPTGSTTTHMIALSADEKQMFTSNVMGKTLSVLDVPGRKLVKTIPTQTNNQRMAISPDGKWFVTNLGQERKVAFYRTSDGELDFAIEIDGGPFVSKFSADGKFLYVMGSGAAAAGRGAGGAAPPVATASSLPTQTGLGGNLRAWKVDVATRAVVATLGENLGSGAGSLAVNPFNGRVYLTSMAHDTMTVIDPSPWTIFKQIKTEKNPDGLFFSAVR